DQLTCSPGNAWDGSEYAPVPVAAAWRTVSPSKAQQPTSVFAEDFGLNGLRQFELAEQVKLRHGLSGAEVVGAKQQPVRAAHQEFPSELEVAADGPCAAARRQVSVNVGVLIHEAIDRSARYHRCLGIRAQVTRLLDVAGNRIPPARRMADERGLREL